MDILIQMKMRVCRLLRDKCGGGGSSQFENKRFAEMCSGSEAGSYLRRIDFMYHSTLGLRVIKKKRERGQWPFRLAIPLSLWDLSRDPLKGSTRESKRGLFTCGVVNICTKIRCSNLASGLIWGGMAAKAIKNTTHKLYLGFK